MPLAPVPRCAHCRTAAVTPDWRPFCSQRCQQFDLARWMNGGYRVAGEPAPIDPNGDEPSVTTP